MASRDLILTNLSVKMVDCNSGSPPERQKLGHSFPILALHSPPHLLPLGPSRNFYEARADDLEGHRRTDSLIDP